jgi:hypothetical protein
VGAGCALVGPGYGYEYGAFDDVGGGFGCVYDACDDVEGAFGCA